MRSFILVFLFAVISLSFRNTESIQPDMIVGVWQYSAIYDNGIADSVLLQESRGLYFEFRKNGTWDHGILPVKNEKSVVGTYEIDIQTDELILNYNNGSQSTRSKLLRLDSVTWTYENSYSLDHVKHIQRIELSRMK